MSLLSEALGATQSYVEQHQNALDASALDARTNHLVSLRRALRTVVAATDPFYATAQLLADRVRVGRTSDGYPSREFDDDSKFAFLLAVHAGIAPSRFLDCINASDLCVSERDQDYFAWLRAGDYRRDNNRVCK